jgi:Ala-tRNA(Pro) deacylase
MSVLAQLKEYLDQNHIKYSVISHSRAFTAQELAQIMHVPGRELAKTVMVKIDGKPAMAVLPATQQIDFARLKQALGANDIDLLTESEFEGYFPECELGAMPPFGNLFNLSVFVSRSLRDDEEIVFNAGSLTDAIRLTYADFERLAQPIVCEFSEKPSQHRVASTSSES